MLDIVLKNGRIVDGTGNPWYMGDVGIMDGKIAVVGHVDQEAKLTIDVKRDVISPGFIDGHCHSDLKILVEPTSDFKLQQGVTTEVVGNCGLAPAPYLAPYADALQQYVQPVLGSTPWAWSWQSVEAYIGLLARSAISENVATYVAHGALRIAVMGFEKRPATTQELQRMKMMLEEGMKAGAIGLSIGLLYAPGSYVGREELAELCSVLPKYGGLLSTHMRGEGSSLIPSIQEVIWIAERSGVPLHVSHLKSAGAINWGKALQAMELIENARAGGLDVTCDVYPYTAGSTSMTTILPPWSLEGGIEATLNRLRSPKERAAIKAELREEQADWDNLICSTGWQSVYVSAVSTEANRRLEGRQMQDIADERGSDPEDAMMDLLLEENGMIAIVYFHMADNDVREIIRYDRSLVASDSLGCVTGKPHPRSYGTFPRLIAKYVREEKLLTLEQAVRKITSFPVQRFKLGSRGLLVPGYQADVTVFNPDTFRDTATYQEPIQTPEGLSHVFVGGVHTMEKSRHTGAKAGAFLHACACGTYHG
ncbi:N-acyl-D-amino-acid deacylase family protein [Paenibacillus mendelii]|uniref:Amidohydrolase family protein n=1 Tax=Paenibacillus mendelii TaxID=206163 RepID=A0ABV6JIG0_9BACL|nr:D-aminoacylase [Paenibacillus mendelii]MCQ6563240.1 D-aminoacylase [Paenibacillus mendelii]